MLDNTGANNLLNTNVGSQSSSVAGQKKTSVNMYYNEVTKRLEKLEIPVVNLEFNNVENQQSSKFLRST